MMEADVIRIRQQNLNTLQAFLFWKDQPVESNNIIEYNNQTKSLVVIKKKSFS